MSFLFTKDRFRQCFQGKSSSEANSKDDGSDELPPPSYEKATKDGQVASDDDVPASISPTWASDIKSAMTFEEFCEYFTASTININTPEYLIGPQNELQVDVVEGVLPQLYPGVVRAQMDDLHIRFHLDSTGLCRTPKSAPSAFKLYVMWIPWFSHEEKSGLLKWLQVVRRASPNSVIVLVRDTLGEDKQLEAAYATLATVHVSGKISALGEETEKLYKVLARAAMLQALATQPPNSNKGSSAKQPGKGGSSARKYMYKGKTEFYKL